MRLTRRIRAKERQVEQARRALTQYSAQFRQVLHQRLASRTALALGFGAGLLLGVRHRRSKATRPRAAAAPSRARAAAQAVERSLPPHWLGHYLIWPLVLASARDFMVTRRPSRREA